MGDYKFLDERLLIFTEKTVSNIVIKILILDIVKVSIFARFDKDVLFINVEPR